MKTNLQDYLTTRQLAAYYRVSRPAMERRLVEVGLCKANRTPTTRAVRQDLCRVLPTWGTHTMLLWHEQHTLAAIKAAEHQDIRNNPDDWATPGWLFDLLDSEFHFNVDAAASPHNAKCPRYFTTDEDGLAQDWGQETAWCNPPWLTNVIGKWVRKAYEESRRGTTVVMLIPYWKGYEWFDRYCVACGQLRHVIGKVYFRGPTGKAIGKDCVVVVFGPRIKGYTNGPSIRKPALRRKS